MILMWLILEMPESFIKSVYESSFRLNVFPKHIIVVSIDLKEPFICVYVGLGWKNSFKMSFSTHLFFRFK